MAADRAWKEMACGGCGEAKHRAKALGDSPRFTDIALVCTGCGSVTHLIPRTFISDEWGRPADGEQDKGKLANLLWKRDSQGSPI